MPLEAGDGFISGLVQTNPVNASDQVAQGDDHLRLIKTALKGTFPNLNGAVTSSPAELNILDGATLSTAELNILDGATLSTAELNILDGVTLTAAQINDAARQAAANVFSSVNSFSGGVRIAGTITETLSLDKAGAIGTKRFSLFVGDGTGGTTADENYIKLLNTNLNFWGGASGTTQILQLSSTGVVVTPGTDAGEVGYNGTPPNTQNGDYTLVLADRGKTIYKASGGAGETITIPANASVAFPIGTQLDIVNNGGGDLTIAITSDTLSWAVGGATGSRTLADHGWAVIKKVAATEWFISGTGLT